jgi:hypothetical protein
LTSNGEIKLLQAVIACPSCNVNNASIRCTFQICKKCCLEKNAIAEAEFKARKARRAAAEAGNVDDMVVVSAAAAEGEEAEHKAQDGKLDEEHETNM